MVHLFLLVSFFFFAFLPNIYANELKEKKRVLVIFYEQSDLPAYSKVEQGIKQGLGAGTEFDIEYFFEYMDSHRNPDQKHKQLLSDLYRHKFSKKKIDLIIAYGVAPLEFVIAHHDDFFQNIPVVFAATRTNIAHISLPPETTGVLSDIDYAGMLNTALEIHPKTRHVAVVNGASHTDLFFEEGFRKAFEPYNKQFDFIYLTRLPFAEIEEKVKNLPEQTVILFYMLLQDGNGKAFVPRQAASILAKEANAPVYGCLDSYFGDGIVGGRMFSLEVKGLRAGEMALRILRGEKASDIPMSSIGTTINKFDWRQFKRFGIREDRLPPDSIVQFKTYSFWESYRWYIVATFFVLLAQSGLIFYLMMARRQRRRAQSQLAERLDFEKMLSTLSARFVYLPFDRIDTEINRVLESIGNALNVDRVSVYEISKENTRFYHVNSHNHIDTVTLPSEYKFDQLPWINQKLMQGEIFTLSNLADLPEEAEDDRNFLSGLGILSLAVIPLSTEKKIIGVLSLIMLRHRQEWPQELLRQCRLVAEILSNAMVRKHHEETLKWAEVKYRVVADFTHDWEYWFNADGSLEYVSPSCERISGYSPREFLGNPALFRDIIIQEDQDVWDSHSCDFRHELKSCEIQYRIQRRDGQICWIEHSCQPVIDRQGSLQGFRACNRDITLRKHSETQLRTAYTEITQLKNQLEAETAYLQSEIKLEHNFDNIIGNSAALKYVLYKVEQIASTESNVLVLGESGTGKELIARAIHNKSPHRDRALVKVNCASLPSDLIESELFGHERGAFTGAHDRQLGRFEIAHGTTIFLDEIGELPLEVQAKLLGVLQDREFERLGSSRTIKVDVRVIAATNRNLEEEVLQGRFREDLFFRLNVFPITVPPLRGRVEDIPLLVQFFVDNAAKRLGKSIEKIPQSVVQKLQAYSWPGNIRELENVIERAVINTSGPKLSLADDLSRPASKKMSPTLKSLQEVEKDHIQKVLQFAEWRIEGAKGAAQILAMNPSTLRSRIRKLGIQKP
ncbi:MAG: ABC transporter substrate binding protein [Desulfopila sp.]|jgi:PAS domain S-box-containing protein|nr:ABC transporter substrate binding protein [Desulfopila sp.]